MTTSGWSSTTASKAVSFHSRQLSLTSPPATWSAEENAQADLMKYTRRQLFSAATASSADCHWKILESPTTATTRSPSGSPYAQPANGSAVAPTSQSPAYPAGRSDVASAGAGTMVPTSASEATVPGPWGSAPPRSWRVPAPGAPAVAVGPAGAELGTASTRVRPATAPTRLKFAPTDSASGLEREIRRENRIGFSTRR